MVGKITFKLIRSRIPEAVGAETFVLVDDYSDVKIIAKVSFDIGEKDWWIIYTIIITLFFSSQCGYWHN